MSRTLRVGRDAPTFGEALRAEMALSELSAKQIASQVGLTRTSLYRVARYHTPDPLRVEHYRRLIELFPRLSEWSHSSTGEVA